MSIKPIAYNEDTKVYRMLHEELDHQFDMLLTDIEFVGNLGPNHYMLVIPCLICGATSAHPVSGGAAPLDIQQLFVNKTTETGCVCGNIEAGNEVLADAHAHLNCARMESDERWQV